MSSSKKLTAFIVVVVLVLLGLWWGGYLGGAAPKADNGQSATALSGAADTVAVVDSSDATIARESSAVDAQMKVSGNQFASFTQNPTAAKADLLSAQLGGVAGLLSKLSARFKARIANLNSAGFNTDVIQGALSDMTLQTSYASSQAGVGGQLAAKAKTEANNDTTLKQVVIELQKSQAYLEAARKDIRIIIAGFKTVSDSQTGR